MKKSSLFINPINPICFGSGRLTFFVSKKDKIEIEPEPKSQKLAKVFYVVKRGDVLSDIADWFDCSNADIKHWNKLKSNNVQKGKKLTIYVVANKTGYYKRINKMTTKLKKKLKRKD